MSDRSDRDDVFSSTDDVTGKQDEMMDSDACPIRT
jgi:hypothetical protein